MANTKTGLLYYTSETDRFKSDLRIKRLKKDMGCDGYAVYEYILNEIYRVGGCFLVWDESTAFDVAEYWGLKETKVNEIVRYCCAVGLFDKALLSNGNVLTSSSIQSRYVNMCIRAKRKEIIIPEQFNILPEESKIILEEYRKIPEVCRKVGKVKKEISLSGNKEKPPLRNNPEIVEMSLSQCEEELRSDQSWSETVCMNTRSTGYPEFTYSTFTDYLQRFFAKLANEGVTSKSPADSKAHFARWLAIELEKQKRNGNNRNHHPTSKQEANDYALRQYLADRAALEQGMHDTSEKPF